MVLSDRQRTKALGMWGEKKRGNYLLSAKQKPPSPSSSIGAPESGEMRAGAGPSGRGVSASPCRQSRHPGHRSPARLVGDRSEIQAGVCLIEESRL
jgi:hypothetical protein